MSGLFAFASGVFSELNTIEKEKRAAKAKNAAAAAESALFEKQEKFKSSLIAGREADTARRELEVTKRASVADALQQALQDGTITEAGMQAIGKGLTTFDPSWIDLTKSASAIEAAGTSYAQLGSLKIPVADSWKTKLNDSDLGVRSATWFNAYQEMALANPEAFVAELEKDDDLRISFLKDLESYGNFHNVYTANKLANKTTGETRGFIGFEKSYANLVTVLTDAGYDIPGISKKAAKGAVLETAVKNGTVQNPTNAIVLSGKDTMKPLEITDQNLLKHLNALATRSGFDSLQDYVNDFENLVPEGNTVEEVYSVLLNAADYQGKMYHLAVKGKGSSDTLANFGDDLIEDYGQDRMLMAQSASALIEPKKADTMASQATLTREGKEGAFKKATGYTIAEVQTGYQAGIKLQTNMATLATGVTEAGTSGFVRYVQQIGISIVGEGGTIDQVFNSEQQGNLYLGDNGQVNANHPKYTTHQMLQDTALGFFGKKAGQALSKIEAAKVALAISMARAADPSGRLSNQDFEVQLGRLGQTGFFGDTLDQMKSKLTYIAEEFARDLRRTELLNTYASDEAITPETLRILEGDRQVQRAIDASTLRTLQASRRDRELNRGNDEQSVSMENYTSAGYTDNSGKDIYVKITNVEGPQYVYEDGSDATNAEVGM